MNLRLIIGMALFLIGLVTAIVAIAGVGFSSEPATTAAANPSAAFGQTVQTFALPAIAGIAMALGGFLMGLGMGNWKNPRTHLEPGDEVVNPEGYHKMKHV